MSDSSIKYRRSKSALHGRKAGQAGNLSCGRGFTLLEVILALGLSMVVIAAIGAAITMYLRLFDSGRTNIEEAQLARVLLRRMADDIRGAVAYNTIDVSKLSASQSAATTTTAASSNSNSTAGGDSQNTSSTPSTASTASSASAASASTESVSNSIVVDSGTDLSSTGPLAIPGLYGNSTQLLIDVSRLPRLDQYMQSQDQSTLSPSTASSTGDRSSALRNIVYNIFGDTSYLTGGSAGTGMQMSCGLIRRDRDRASALMSVQNGEELDQDDAAQVIAPEVESIGFSYFDGSDWYSYWDSSENGGLPLAVQITLRISRAAKNGQAQLPGVYSLVVNIPAARKTNSSSDSSTTGGTTTTGGTATGGN
jgi:type II secretory pathway pseudopilin PulG